MTQPEKLFQTTGKLQQTNVVKDFRALRNHVIVTEMEFNERKLASGIVLLGDDGKSEGIRPRWGKVLKVGPEQVDVKVGQWVYVEHGRWTRGLKIKLSETDEEIVARRIDPDGIIGVQDETPNYDDTISTAVSVARKER